MPELKQSQLDKYKLNMAGEYRVCAELLRHGLLASVTMGNLKGADIHVVTPKRKVIVIEVKTSQSDRFVTSFFQKYRTEPSHAKSHPDYWVLCKLGVANGDKHNASEDRFFILTHAEMALAQALRNGFTKDFNWEAVHAKCAKGVDNVQSTDLAKFENAWRQLKKASL